MPDDSPSEEIHKDLPVDEVAAAVCERFPEAVFRDSFGQPVVYVARETWHDVAAFLRDEHQFTQCLDVCAVDHLVDTERFAVPGVTLERFEVVANFLSSDAFPTRCGPSFWFSLQTYSIISVSATSSALDGTFHARL